MNGKKTKSILLLVMTFVSLFAGIYGIKRAAAVSPRGKQMPPVNVLIFANRSGGALPVALGLDPMINFTQFVGPERTDADFDNIDWDSYNVTIIDSYLPENETQLWTLIGHINGTYGKMGVIFFGGNYSAKAITIFSRLLPIEFVIYKDTLDESLRQFYLNQTGLPFNPNEGYLSYIYNRTQSYEIVRNQEIQVAVSREQKALPDDQKSMYVTRIAWTSCPLLYDRLLTYSARKGAQTLVEIPTTQEPLVVTWNYTGDPAIQVLFISMGTAWLYDSNGKLEEWNEPFKLWPYFNYFMYLAVYDCAGLPPDQIETYDEWPWSPIPHTFEATVWMIFVASLWVFNFILFFTLGRKRKIDEDVKHQLEEELAEKTPENEEGAEDSGGVDNGNNDFEK